MKYTNEEIQSNISKLNSSINLKKKERTELSQHINALKKQVLEWEDLDKSQLKFF